MYRIKNLKLQVYKFASSLSRTNAMLGLGVILFFAFFFYRSAWAIPFMIPFGVMAVLMHQKKEEEKRNRQHLEQFKECILSVEASLRAGYAVENAFVESIRDMKLMYGEQSQIVQELQFLQKGLRNNETLESLLFSITEECPNHEIVEFAEVFSIAKRNSGNVSGVIDLFCGIISQKIASDQEIQTVLASKRLEQKVMNIMPFGMVLYLDITNPGYFSQLFHNLSGVVLMSICLIVYVTAYVWSERILSKAFK